MSKEMESIRVFAPATVANVACGFDVLGFALEYPGDELSIRKTDSETLVILKIDGAEDLPTDPEKNVVGVSIQSLLNELGSKQGLEISIKKGVKPGSGIGSSAASSAGAVVAVNKLLNAGFSKLDLVRFAMEGERLASGTAHADNVAPAIFGGFTLVRSYNPLDIIKLNTPDQLYCTVIHPQIEVKTSDARSVLRINLTLKKAIVQWGNLGGLVAGLFLEDYPLIGRSLEDVIVEPIRSVLIPGFDTVKEAAIQAGALGCSISGSGPSIFALSKGIEIAQNVKAAMAEVYDSIGIEYIMYISKVSPEGVKILQQ
jgi:homoserine kinase